jgi:hypothetical protein
MIGRRVVPYIPFSCSLTWLDVAEDEVLPVRVHTAFHPEWYCLRSSVNFGERWHKDPFYRHECFVEMARIHNREFGTIGAAYDLEAIPYGISQAYGCSPMAALFGKDVRFDEKGYTDNTGSTRLDATGEIARLGDIADAPIIQDIFRQIELIEGRGEVPDGVLNLQGVLNTAFRIRGQDIFIDIMEEPAKARKVLAMVCSAMIAVLDAIYARQRSHGLERNHFVTSNCTVNMLSREQYREFILPFDAELANHFPYFGIHNCGWSVDEYIDAYAEIKDLAYLDFGLASDFRKIRQAFPGPTTLSPILNPTDFYSLSQSEMRKMLERIKGEIGACQIILGGLGADFPTEQIVSFYKMVSELLQVPTDALFPDFPDAF